MSFADVNGGPAVARLLRNGAIGFVVLVCAIAEALGAGGMSEFGEFRDKYHCEVVRRLGVIKASAGTSDRFLILAMTLHPNRFTQCLFDDDGMTMLCEASSGFYSQKPGEPRNLRLPPGALAELGRLGFSTDGESGNFKREINSKSVEDLSAVADLLLAGLYYGYGARLKTQIDITAPLAPRLDPKRAGCTPII